MGEDEDSMRVKIYDEDDGAIQNCKINGFKFTYHTPNTKSHPIPQKANKLFAELLKSNKEEYVAITRWGKIIGALELRNGQFFNLHSVKWSDKFMAAVYKWQDVTGVPNANPTFNGMHTVKQGETIRDDFLPF